jgi:hypothetical protein
MEPIIKKIIESGLYHSKEVSSEANSLTLDVSDKPLDCNELLSIYRGRAIQLKKFSSKHAIDLQFATEEFCSNLEAHDSYVCNFYHLMSPLKHEYLVSVVPDSMKVLGCLKTISKLSVTQSEWDALWVE